MKHPKVSIKIYQKADKNHQDSFWYDGDIALFKYKNREILVVAAGDIRIHNKKGELVYDCKPRNSGFPFKLEQDKDLKKIGNNYDDDFHWENNNWFELFYKETDWSNWESILGDVFYEYNEMIKQAKESIKDDAWWQSTWGKAICLECKKEFIQERDIQLCDGCVKKFNLDKLWKDHDNNKIDALDFNESSKIREKYRVK